MTSLRRDCSERAQSISRASESPFEIRIYGGGDGVSIPSAIIFPPPQPAPELAIANLCIVKYYLVPICE